MDETAGKSAEPPKAITPNALGHGEGPGGAGKRVRVTVRCPVRPDFNGGAFPGYWCAGVHFASGESTQEIDAERLQDIKDDTTITLVKVEELDGSSAAPDTSTSTSISTKGATSPKAGFGEPGVTTEMNSGAKAMGHDDPKELKDGPGKPPKSSKY